MKAPRAVGNNREDEVCAMFAALGRYAVVQRGSGSQGTKQQQRPLTVAGDVVVLATDGPLVYDGSVAGGEGVQIEVGGKGKRFAAAFAELRARAVPGYALVVAVRIAGRGATKPRWRWLLADDGEGWTECADAGDLLATIDARRA